MSMGRPPSCLVRSMLQIAGVLSPRGCKVPMLYTAYSIISLCGIACCLGGSIAYFVLESGTPIEKLQSFQISITILNGLLKHYRSLAMQKNVERILDEFDQTWDQLYEEAQNRMTMDPTEKLCSKIYKILIFVFSTMVGLNLIMPILFYFLLGAAQLNLQILLPFDKNKYFILAHLSLALLSYFPFITNVAHTFLYFCLSQQLVGSMKVLQKKLREEKTSDEIIRIHHDIIRLMNLVNSQYGWILYFETNTIAIECSCAAYVFCKQDLLSDNKDALVIDLTNLLFCYYIPYVICYCGTIIKTESENMFRESYNGLWLEGDLESKNKLRTFMIGAYKPLTLHYKNLTVFDMELFLAIINGTYTFLNVIVWLEKVEQK